MTPLPWPSGVARYVLERCESTNLEAASLAATHAGASAWILAHEQTAGKGRRGRAWQMPRGNFAASLLEWPMGGRAEPLHCAQRSFVMALALYDALLDLGVAQERLALKWPNDVLLDGRKLAGILLEAVHGKGGQALIIGVGVNLTAHPAPGDLPEGALAAVDLLSATGERRTPEALLERLAARFAQLAARHDATGFAPIRAAWSARARGMGQEITVRLMRETRQGRFLGIDETGALMLGLSRGDQEQILHIAAGDVFF